MLTANELFALILIVPLSLFGLVACDPPKSELTQAREACVASGGRLASYSIEYGDNVKFTCSYDGGNYHEEHVTRSEHKM